MSFFGFFKLLKNVLSVGGNFAYISQNMATIYYAIGETSFGKSLDEEKRIFATGILDASMYLLEGTISLEDIAKSIALGQIGEVSLGFYSRKHRNTFEYEENEKLIGFTMQMEAFILWADVKKYGYSEVVDQVVNHRHTIETMINKTLKQGENSPLYPNIYSMVLNSLSDPSVTELIENYDQYKYL